MASLKFYQMVEMPAKETVVWKGYIEEIKIGALYGRGKVTHFATQYVIFKSVFILKKTPYLRFSIYVFFFVTFAFA